MVSRYQNATLWIVKRVPFLLPWVFWQQQPLGVQLIYYYYKYKFLIFFFLWLKMYIIPSYCTCIALRRFRSGLDSAKADTQT